MLQPVDDSEWRYINIRSANSTNKQKIVSVVSLSLRDKKNWSSDALFISTYHYIECLGFTSRVHNAIFFPTGQLYHREPQTHQDER